MASQYPDRWTLQLHPNISRTATLELKALRELLASVRTPSANSSDSRVHIFSGKPVVARDYYALLTFRGFSCAPADIVWHKVIPNRWRVLLWLAHRGHLNVRTAMLHKQWNNIEHPFCDLCPAEETIDHIVLRCVPAHYLWQKLELLHQAISSLSLKDFVFKMREASGHWTILIAACAAQLWKVRNARVFDSEAILPDALGAAIAEMLLLWCARSNMADRRYRSRG